MDTDETQIGILTGDAPTGYLYSKTTEAIIGAAYEVHRVLGYGFLEKVYQRALQAELLKREVKVELEAPITVRYKGVVVGEFAADLLVEGDVLVELKVSAEYRKEDEAQLLNELKATGHRVGLLINFGRTKAAVRRFIM